MQEILSWNIINFVEHANGLLLVAFMWLNENTPVLNTLFIEKDV